MKIRLNFILKQKLWVQRGLQGLKELTETCCAESKSEVSNFSCTCPCKNPCCSMKALHVMYPQTSGASAQAWTHPLLLCSGKLPASQLSWLGWNHLGTTENTLFLTSTAFTDFRLQRVWSEWQNDSLPKQSDIKIEWCRGCFCYFWFLVWWLLQHYVKVIYCPFLK